MNILVNAPADSYREKFFTNEIVERLHALGHVTWNDTADFYPERELQYRLQSADVLIIGRGKHTGRVTKQMLAGCPTRFIGYTGGSMKKQIAEDVFDGQVAVVCGNDAFTAPLAESTLMLMLMALRKVNEFSFRLKSVEGYWPRKQYTESLIGKTVGILGYGAIARELIGFLKPFGCRLLVADPYISSQTAAAAGMDKVSNEELFARSDVISIHHTLTPETYQLVDQSLLRLMKDQAVLVNTARGAIIHEEQLVQELLGGRIFAALDVFEREPLPADSPLRKLEHVILTPHMGGSTVDCYMKQVSFVIDDLERFAQGEPMHYALTRERYARMTEKVTG